MPECNMLLMAFLRILDCIFYHCKGFIKEIAIILFIFASKMFFKNFTILGSIYLTCEEFEM